MIMVIIVVLFICHIVYGEISPQKFLYANDSVIWFWIVPKHDKC